MDNYNLGDGRLSFSDNHSSVDFCLSRSHNFYSCNCRLSSLNYSLVNCGFGCLNSDYSGFLFPCFRNDDSLSDLRSAGNRCDNLSEFFLGGLNNDGLHDCLTSRFNNDLFSDGGSSGGDYFSFFDSLSCVLDNNLFSNGRLSLLHDDGLRNLRLGSPDGNFFSDSWTSLLDDDSLNFFMLSFLDSDYLGDFFLGRLDHNLLYDLRLSNLGHKHLGMSLNDGRCNRGDGRFYRVACFLFSHDNDVFLVLSMNVCCLFISCSKAKLARFLTVRSHPLSEVILLVAIALTGKIAAVLVFVIAFLCRSLFNFFWSAITLIASSLAVVFHPFLEIPLLMGAPPFSSETLAEFVFVFTNSFGFVTN